MRMVCCSLRVLLPIKGRIVVWPRHGGPRTLQGSGSVVATANLHLLPKLAAAKAQTKAVTSAAVNASELEDRPISINEVPPSAADGGVPQLRVLRITPTHCQRLMRYMCREAACHSSNSAAACNSLRMSFGHDFMFPWFANAVACTGWAGRSTY